MSYKPFHLLMNRDPKPQFILEDHAGRRFGVVEHYNADPREDLPYILFEFFPAGSPGAGSPGAAGSAGAGSGTADRAARPRVWFDAKTWTVLEGKGENLPDPDFERGFESFLSGWSEEKRRERRERIFRCRFWELIRLAEAGYTVAFQEAFPGEARREDFPQADLLGKTYWVDDQYHIRPGDFKNQVTLVFVETGAADGERPGPARSAAGAPGPDHEAAGTAGPGREAIATAGSGAEPAPQNPEAALLVHWIFGEGYEIVRSALPEADEEAVHAAMSLLTRRPGLEALYRERLRRMREMGMRLQVSPKPYEPMMREHGRPEGEEPPRNGKKP